jgi:septal ring factor EnvC (AmiA/AmiB activator)
MVKGPLSRRYYTGPMSLFRRRIDQILAVAFALAAPFAVAHAQSQSRQPQAERLTGPDAEKVKRERDLEAIRAEQKKATETEARLKSEIETIGEDRRKLNRALIDTATRIRAAEARITASETRLRTLDENQNMIRRSLDERRWVIAEVLAALQRIGRRPPPALLMRPEQALQSVRTAMMLGAVLPEMRIEAETLANDLAELVAVRKEIAFERERAASDLATLSEDKQRMALLVDERQKRQTDAERALTAERDRAAALAHQAETLKDLIGALEQEIAKAAARGDPTRPAPDSGRLGPAIAFASAKGALPFPVAGIRVREFGGSDGLGGLEKGDSLVTRAGAQVTAPCDGWVVYAGPFRSYGQLLILNAGGGYHVLVAGMERISVNLGQFVLAGEPVASMGGGPQAAAVAIGASQPVLYVEFRKDGTPIDPGPWWAKSDSEKVRG